MTKASKNKSSTSSSKVPTGKGTRFCGKPGLSGPPRNNRSALRHGLKAGQLPADAKYIEVRLNLIRRNLEDAVLESKGKISMPDAGYIQTAIRWERHAALAQRWLTKQYRKLKPMEQLKFSNEVASASAKRDAAIEMLELGDAQTTVIEALYAKVVPALPAPTEDDQ